MPEFYVNLFKEFRDINSSFNSFEGFNNLSSYHNLFRKLTTAAHYKIPSVIELINGRQFDLSTDQLGKPRAKHKIVEKPFKINIYAYKLFYCKFPSRLDIHFNHKCAFYYRYTFSNVLNYGEKEKIKSLIRDRYNIDPSLNFDKESVIDPNQTILKIEDGETLKIHFYNYGLKIAKDLKYYKEDL